ncbi:sulfonate/nitrate/taurine ABC transporter ATP-binding protein [Planococcus antarcticus DSM 14505]|uniref:Sulfonate/nitrate/taurine ABC transporter ATP-binding protein n=1 Tax=Planococcus antarcticus DSM 14505 TaxID=1185653 RepID=A0AA87LR69_9BACL|nr:ABC transporter ATP-binding protein [Planococcus antarcticus]EIM05084.1 sulfonate/nitrate/taurine ABC transporter ATP-binding protein [Planococcus antarcticus DSM 14505]
MAKLWIDNLTKCFDGNEVLKNLSFHIEEDEFVAILGPSGSGKSTLFHLIGGLYTPNNGDILLDGKKINGQKGSISYMPQTPSLFPWRTVLENVLLGAELTGKKEPQAALQMMEKAGLKGYENAYPHQLSGGMKQRAAFIRSLLSPQSLICLDEPFSALDEFTRSEMQKWLLSIWQQNKRSILFVTHNIEEALFLADRILVLSEKPANIIAEFEVNFPRPREETITLTEEFLQYKKDIYKILKKGKLE